MRTTHTIFFVFWAVLGVAGAAFSFFNRNAGLKRRVLPWSLVFVGTAFTSAVLFFSREPRVLFAVVPAVVVISCLNMWMTKFCDACGRTIINRSFVKLHYCPQCGAGIQH